MPDRCVVSITVFVAVDDVMRAIGCSRSQAYAYLREAAGRKHGDRGLLRVPALIWERYANARFGGPPKGDVSSRPLRSRHGRRPAAPVDLGSSVIPITRPRTKRRR